MIKGRVSIATIQQGLKLRGDNITHEVKGETANKLGIRLARLVIDAVAVAVSLGIDLDDYIAAEFNNKSVVINSNVYISVGDKVLVNGKESN